MSARDVTTPVPGESVVAIREIVPPFAVEGSTMMDLPPREAVAPRTKSTWPPTPL